MNRSFITLAICFFTGLLSLTSCSNYRYQASLYKKKPAFYSYIIGNINNDHIDLENYSDAYVTPASCQKTITALLALKSLGHDYKYHTKLLVQKNERGFGDVVIKFSGDPTLTSEKLKELLLPIKMKKINGNIILDASAFKTASLSDYISMYDLGKSFSTPVSAVNLDKNLIRITISPTKKLSLASIKQDGEAKIENFVIFNEEKTNITSSYKNGKFILRGNINIHDKNFELKISPVDLEPYIIAKIRNILKDLGINKKVFFVNDASKLPKNLHEYAEISSDNLADIIKPANKISDNLTFDALYLTMVHKAKPEGVDDWSDGYFTIKDLIKTHLNIDLGGAVLVDGSGLSRYNRIQPRKLYEILKQGYSDRAFIESLAAPGEAKTTLDSRKNLPDSVRAKTGHLAMHNCLCGFDIKREKAFVFIASSYAPPVKEMNDVIDNFLRGYFK